MFELIRAAAALLADRRGVTAVEYAVIAGVLIALIAAAFTPLGNALQDYMSTIQL
jgi:Flp pilus assembly pilin Flp